MNDAADLGDLVWGEFAEFRFREVAVGEQAGKNEDRNGLAVVEKFVGPFAFFGE